MTTFVVESRFSDRCYSLFIKLSLIPKANLFKTIGIWLQDFHELAIQGKWMFGYTVLVISLIKIFITSQTNGSNERNIIFT